MDSSQEIRENQIKTDLARGEVIGISGNYQTAPDFPTQRVIINYFKTNNPEVIARYGDAPIHSRDRDEFAARISDGRLNPEHHSFNYYNKYTFLEYVPTEIDDPNQRAALSNQVIGEINASSAFSNEKILMRYIMGSQASEFSPQRLADLVKDYSTPEWMNDTIAREIMEKFPNNPERQRELLESADKLLTRIYGRRQKVYTQFRILINDILKTTNQETAQEPSVSEQSDPSASKRSGLRETIGKGFNDGANQAREKVSGAREKYLSINALMEQHQALQDSLRLANRSVKQANDRADAAEARARELEKKLAELDINSPKAQLYKSVGFWPGAFDGWNHQAIRRAVAGMRQGQSLHKRDDAVGNGNGNGDLAKINAALDEIENPSLH